jgi:CBS domain-containing protein
MTAGEVMTRDVITIRPDLPIMQAMQLMLQHNISGLPVMDGGKLVSIVTESDFLRHAEADTTSKRRRLIELLVAPQQALTRESHDRKVDEIMTTDLVTVSENVPLDGVVGVMRKHDLKRVLVLRDGQLVGVISRADLIAALVHATRAAIKAAGNNHRRRAELARLEKDLWMHRITRN